MNELRPTRLILEENDLREMELRRQELLKRAAQNLVNAHLGQGQNRMESQIRKDDQ